MNSFQKKARAFFREGEYELCIKEALKRPAQGGDPDPETTPYLFMLYLHDVYGIRREEMWLREDDVILSSEGAKKMVQHAAQNPDISAKNQDEMMDLLGFIRRHKK